MLFLLLELQRMEQASRGEDLPSTRVNKAQVCAKLEICVSASPSSLAGRGGEGKRGVMQYQMLKLGGKGELLCFVGGSFQATARCATTTFGQGGCSAPLELRLRGFFFLQLRRILDFSAAHQRRFQIKWFRPRSGSSGRCLEVNHGVGGGGPNRVSFFSSRSS
jgi:hypothetical protein